MNWAVIRALVEKDLTVVLRTRLVILPMLLVPVIMLVLAPTGIALGAMYGAAHSAHAANFDRFISAMPEQVRAVVLGYRPEQLMLMLLLGYVWAPLFLLVPTIVASGIAADSFAGERERKTLEALLYTPLTDAELFIGKMLGAWLPAVAVSVIGFVLYSIVANVVGWPVMGRIWFPNPSWVLLVVFVSPGMALVALGLVVIMSARVKTAQEAFQVGGLAVLPVLFLVVGQATGVLYFGPRVVCVLALIVWTIALGIIRLGYRGFRRTELIARA